MISNNRGVVVWLIGVCVFLCFGNKVNLLRLYDTPGETWPPRVEIMVGDSVNIYCRMNLTAFQNQCTVKDLYFINTSTQQKADTKIVNETTIMYGLNNAPEQQTTYLCMCGNDAIDDTKVFVGYPPQYRTVTKLTCSSYDFMSMQCNFTRPYNPVMSKYNLSFHFNGPNYKFYPQCDYDRSPLVVCEIAGGIYRASEEIYKFKLYEENSLDNTTERFDINNTEIMKPAKPGQDFSITSITTDAAIFSFRMPKYESFYRNNGLQWELFLKPQNLTEYSILNAVKPSVRRSNEFTVRLLNLKYAYYEYQLRLRVRLHGAEAWSEPFTYKFRTEPRRPDRPPRIDVGGFYIDPSETIVHLYWELLQPYEYNGYNFGYIIENQNGPPLTTDSNSASFAWHKGVKYEFRLRSLNHIGLSESFSEITIPAMLPVSKSKTHTTPAVHNIYHEKNDTFTLTWEAPKARTDLEDYTVFWCRSKRALLNGCEGSIHFQHISREVQKFTTSPQEHTLNLAVSANYKDFNTGMHWTQCTMNEESDLVKMEPEVDATSATTIKIQWTSEKICPSIIDGYNLTFCEVAETETIVESGNDEANYLSGVQSSCRDGNTKHHELIPKTQNRLELTGLKPFTKYEIEMFMYSARKVGKTSDPQYVRTFEAAPSHPRHLNYSHITNTSALLSWLPPSEHNGIVRTYTVVFNNKNRDIPMNSSNPYGRITYDLKDLNSSTPYKVYVLAHTISNSHPSNDVHFTTLVGYPKVPRDVIVQDSNTVANITWARSSERADYYEVAITLMQNDEILRRRISVVLDANSCVYSIPYCFDRNYRTIVDVRAVNVDENDVEDTAQADDNEQQYYDGNKDLSCVARDGTTKKHTRSLLERQIRTHERLKDPKLYRLYKSDWQRGTSYSCSSGDLGIFFVYSASAVLISVGVFVLFYLMRRQYNKMANIHCTLPPGLDAYVSKDITSGNGSAFPHEFLAVKRGEISTSTRNAEIHESKVTMQRASDYHNEEHRLLETTSQDSISLNEQSHTVKQLQSTLPKMVESKSGSEVGVASNPMFDRNCDSTFSPQYAQSHSSEIAPTPNPTGNYIQASNFAAIHTTAPQFAAPISNGYIKPNALTNWQNIVMPTSTTVSSPGGYISVESIDANPQNVNVPNNNGYIQANFLEGLKPNFQNTHNSPTINETALQTPVTNGADSYTTLEQLGKMSAALPSVNNWNQQTVHGLTQEIGIPIVTPSNFTPGISGYVTPRELTAFGQQQQRNFN